MTAFKRLVRFASPRSGIHYGDLLAVSENQYTVRRLEGNLFTGLKATEDTLKVDSVSNSNTEIVFLSNSLYTSWNAPSKAHLLCFALD
jgi:hypothetical protein